MDIEWYGVDRQGNIAVFLSAGEGNIPEFVCEDKERAEALNDYFESAERVCDAVLCRELSDGAKALAEELSGKGLYYFDSDDGSQIGVCNGQRYYTKRTQPTSPLKYTGLPTDIREMLKQNDLDIDDFSAVNVVDAAHAYPYMHQ